MPTASASKRCEILCYGPIGSWFGVSAAEVMDTLKANATAEEITVRVHSDGGDAMDGIAICNALRAHPGRKVVMVDGLAGSAASMIAMAGDEVVMAESSMMMLHNPWTVAFGDGGALRETADTMDAMARAYVAGYARKTGKSAEDVKALMQKNSWIAGNWMTAAEAKDVGLCDRIGPPVAIQARTLDSSRLRGLPPQAATFFGAAAPPLSAPAATTQGEPPMSTTPTTEAASAADLKAAQAELAALKAQAAAQAPVLAQLAAVTGETDPGKQQAALASLQERKTALEGKTKELCFALARARNVPPQSMLGWEHLPLDVLQDNAQKAQAAQPFAPGAPAGGSAPAAADAVSGEELTDFDRAFFRSADAQMTEDEMRRRKAEARKGVAR